MRLSSPYRLLALIVMVALSGCSQHWSWHQRLTLVVDTPAGEKAASSVTACEAVRREGKYVLPEARGMGTGCGGEAVVLEVAPGRYLFALLGKPDAFATFFPGAAPAEVADRLEQLRETREVPRDQYPMLVTFGDVSDPKTVTRVDPQDLAASFGPGVALSAVTLEITDAPVTGGVVEGVLGWLSWPRERLLAAGGGRNPVQISVDGGELALGRTDFRSK
jgi:hypothetical protein